MYISFWLVKTNSGDNMILVYMENIDFMRKIINYLDNTNVKYTTNLSTNYDYILIAELNNKVIKDETIPVEDVKRIVDYLNQHHLEYYIEANDGLYGSLNFKVRGVEALRQYGMKDPDVMEIYPAMTFPKCLYVENVTKINYILESYQDYLDFKEAFPEFKDLTWGGKGEKAIFGDCALKHIDKQEAIKELIDYLKIGQEDIIAFGDAEIDIPMFDIAGISVCVGNGREEAKKHATYVTKPVSEDGIEYALKHFEII